MKIRIKFKKFGSMKFLGHLDVMRFFQKALRRAQLDICYTGGFSPHPVMSFASPLGVGLTSDGEYLDIEVNSCGSSAEMVERLNEVMVEGVEIVSFRILPNKMKSAMSQVAAADYRLTFRPGYEPGDWHLWEEKWREFASLPSLVVVKKTKKKEQEADLRPLIHSLSLDSAGISMRVAAGSVNNLKPEFLMETFYHMAGWEWNPFTFQIHRQDLYMENNGAFVSMEEAGQEIDRPLAGEAMG